VNVNISRLTTCAMVYVGLYKLYLKA